MVVVMFLTTGVVIVIGEIGVTTGVVITGVVTTGVVTTVEVLVVMTLEVSADVYALC